MLKAGKKKKRYSFGGSLFTCHDLWVLSLCLKGRAKMKNPAGFYESSKIFVEHVGQ